MTIAKLVFFYYTGKIRQCQCLPGKFCNLLSSPFILLVKCLYTAAYSVCKNAEDAEDAVQDTFIQYHTGKKDLAAFKRNTAKKQINDCPSVWAYDILVSASSIETVGHT